MPDLIEQPDGSWRLPDPVTCPAGHPFRLVRRSYTPCRCAGTSGHTRWHCECGQTVEDPPHTDDAQAPPWPTWS